MIIILIIIIIIIIIIIVISEVKLLRTKELLIKNITLNMVLAILMHIFKSSLSEGKYGSHLKVSCQTSLIPGWVAILKMTYVMFLGIKL